MGFFRASGLNDPRVFAAGVTAILTDYPPDVVRFVSGPRGLASRAKFLPTIAEVRDACEAAMAPLREEAAWERKVERSRRAALPAPREQRPSLAELKGRYGADWGIVALGPAGMPVLTEAEQVERENERQAAFQAEAADLTFEVGSGLRKKLDEMRTDYAMRDAAE